MFGWRWGANYAYGGVDHHRGFGRAKLFTCCAQQRCVRVCGRAGYCGARNKYTGNCARVWICKCGFGADCDSPQKNTTKAFAKTWPHVSRSKNKSRFACRSWPPKHCAQRGRASLYKISWLKVCWQKKAKLYISCGMPKARATNSRIIFKVQRQSCLNRAKNRQGCSQI